ncbi:MAG: molybdenum cofactor biosysynthesis protein, partial [Planctomycetia bacterium]|nr:molybdenum cofactor biosysynthesis protein [Planctomycetia bacterium]
MPTLDRITLYPVKSLDGIDVETARVLPSGALEHDRRWRLVDLDGRVVNAKRT